MSKTFFGTSLFGNVEKKNMNYIITVIGPNGNGQYEPSFQDGEWILKDCPHPMENRNPVPDWSIIGILDMLRGRFGDNFYLRITPVREH